MLWLMEAEACIGTLVQVEVEIVEDLQVGEEMDFGLRKKVVVVAAVVMMVGAVMVVVIMEVGVRWVEVEFQEENQAAMVGSPQEKRCLKLIERPHLN